MASEEEFEQQWDHFHDTPIDELEDKDGFLDWWFNEVISGGDWEYFYDNIAEAWQDFREQYY